MTIAATSTDSMLYTIQGMYIDNQYYGGISSYTINYVNRDFTVRAVINTPTITWSISPYVMPGSGSWTSVAYGGGRYVAVSSNQDTKPAYSTDGINWTSATGMPDLVERAWYSVCYGNGIFVAAGHFGTTSQVSSQSYCMYSSDGSTWTMGWHGKLTQLGRWYSVCYGNGKYLIVGDGKSVWYCSASNMNYWVASSMPSDSSWISVCYGNDKFVAVNNSNTAAYSTDGITWTAITMSNNVHLRSVCYGNGKFVAVARDSAITVYSSDGITWTKSTMPSSAGWYSVCYGAGRFVAIRSDVAYSSDGINWVSGTIKSLGNAWNYVCYGGNKYVAVCGNTQNAYLVL